MLNTIKNIEDLENLEQFNSLQNQVKAVKLQYKWGKQNFHEDMKKLFEPVTDTIKNTYEGLRKSIFLTSKENNKTLENLNNRLLELMYDRSIMASILLSFLSKNTNPENKSQFKLLKEPILNRVNEFLIKKTIPVTLHNIWLTFRDTDKKFELRGDL